MKKILLLLSFAPLFNFGQTLDSKAFYNDGSLITVQSGASIYIQGTLTNTNSGDLKMTEGSLVNVQGNLVNSAGSMYPDGVIELKGDIDNTGGVRFYPQNPTPGEKVVKFIGDGVQAIKGDFTDPLTNSFYNLVIDKGVSNSSNSSYVELQNNVRVDGSLVFGSAIDAATYTHTANSTVTNNGGKGVIKTYTGSTDYTLNITQSALTAIAGYPSLQMGASINIPDAYVQTRGARGIGAGGLKRTVQHLGNTPADAYVFPIGTETKQYQAVRINFKSINGANDGSGVDYVRGMFCNGASTTGALAGYVGHLSQYCIGCYGGYGHLPDNNGINVIYGADATAWPGSLPNTCSPGNQQWVILEDGIKNHGYWSFESVNEQATGYPAKYSLETFPTNFTAEGNIAPGYSEETWRTMHYKSGVNDDPSQDADNWGDMSSPAAAGYPFAIEDMSDLLTYTRNTPCYDWHNPGVPGGVYTGFSHFSIKKSKSNNALPVELIYLKAEPVSNQFIQVSWATAVEINNRGFEVMRSTDGINFSNVGWVDGHNNSTTTQTYAFDDHNVAPNVMYYYKLNQIDNDGDNQETYIVNAMITAGDVFSVSEFIPNPAKDQSRVVINTSVEQTIDVKMFDMLGRELSKETYNLSTGENAIYFDTNMLSDATYTAVITAGNKVYSKKLVVAKQ